MGRNQVFLPGELPLVVLALLERQPLNRYELMAELSRLFGPRYKASPGSVYPAVAALHEQGLIAQHRTGGRPRYRLSRLGREALDHRREALATIEVREGVRFGTDGGLEPVLERFVARLLPLSGRVDAEKVEYVLDETASVVEAMSGGVNGD